jgi:type II secretory pathway component PulM
MTFSELSTRDKRSLALGGLVLAVFMTWQFVFKPVQARLVSLNRIVDSKEQMLGEIRKKALDLQGLKTELEHLKTQISGQPNTGKMLALLEQIQLKHDMKKWVTRMRPSTIPLGKDYEQIVVSIELTGINFEKLVAFLVDVKAMKLTVGVEHLTINKNKSPAGDLTVAMDLVTVTVSQSGSNS